MSSTPKVRASSGFGGTHGRAIGIVDVTYSTANRISSGTTSFTTLGQANAVDTDVKVDWTFDFASDTNGSLTITSYNIAKLGIEDTPYKLVFRNASTTLQDLVLTGSSSLAAFPLTALETYTLEISAHHVAPVPNSATSTAQFAWSLNSPAPVPEPSTLVLMCGGFAAAATYRGIRRRRHALRPERGNDNLAQSAERMRR